MYTSRFSSSICWIRVERRSLPIWPSTFRLWCGCCATIAFRYLSNWKSALQLTAHPDCEPLGASCCPYRRQDWLPPSFYVGVCLERVSARVVLVQCGRSDHAGNGDSAECYARTSMVVYVGIDLDNDSTGDCIGDHSRTVYRPRFARGRREGLRLESMRNHL